MKKIKCKICKHKCKNLHGLAIHINWNHKDYTIKKYYDEFEKKNREGICHCGKETAFDTLITGYLKYCSVKCSKKYISNSKNIHKKIIRTKLKNNNLTQIDGKPLFNYFAPKIGWIEEVRRDPNDERILQVTCKKCSTKKKKKWFIPTPNALGKRIGSFNNIGDGSYLYCSNKCKNSCSIFGRPIYQSDHPIHDENMRPYYNEWSNAVKENANYKCERCGSTENLVSHHIKPVKTHPNLVADIDNGICFCNKCDKKAHQLPGCKTGQLASLIC